MIKYSFLVAVYNNESYLRKCIDSVISQKGFSGEYEIILIDDGSTDSAGRICDEYGENYSNIKVIHKENEGLLFSRGDGVKNAHGEYLIFVDSDDYIEDSLLEKVDKYINQYHPDYLSFGYYRENSFEQKPNYITSKEYEILTSDEMLKLFVTSDSYNNIWNKVVKRKILSEQFDDIYNIKINGGEDKLQTSYIIKASKKIVFIRDCLYHYLIRKDSIVHRITEKEIIDIVDVYKRVEEVIEYTIINNQMKEDLMISLIKDYKSIALNGTLLHLYKYNKRKDIPKSDKVLFMHKLLDDNYDFFANEFNMNKMKEYNKYRYKLFFKRKFKLLLLIDAILFRIQLMMKVNI